MMKRRTSPTFFFSSFKILNKLTFLSHNFAFHILLLVDIGIYIDMILAFHILLLGDIGLNIGSYWFDIGIYIGMILAGIRMR